MLCHTPGGRIASVALMPQQPAQQSISDLSWNSTAHQSRSLSRLGVMGTRPEFRNTSFLPPLNSALEQLKVQDHGTTFPIDMERSACLIHRIL
jgi:hypothetical protein